MSPKLDFVTTMSSDLHRASAGMPVAKFTKPTQPHQQQIPQPPKRLRSAFIIFSAEKHKEIRAGLVAKGISEKTTKVAKMVSEAWKKLTPEEKKVYEDKAEEDKVRYQAEKDMFKGTWKVKKRKDPTAPKRPSSAYLAFSNSRRALATKENPVATNAEISKILGKMWRECPPDIKQKYIDEELKLREQYKIDMAKWKKEQKELKRNNRKAAAAEAKKAREMGELSVNNSAYHEDLTAPTPLQFGLPAGLANANSNSSYSRLLAAAGMNTGLNSMNMNMSMNNMNMGNNSHQQAPAPSHHTASNGLSNFSDAELAFLRGANFASEQNNRNQFGNNNTSQLQQLQQQQQNLQRSSLSALLGGNDHHHHHHQGGNSQQQQQQMFNRLSSVNNGNDFANLDFGAGNMNSAGQQGNQFRSNAGNGELDVRSLLALNNNFGNNMGSNGQNQFNLGNSFF